MPVEAWAVTISQSHLLLCACISEIHPISPLPSILSQSLSTGLGNGTQDGACHSKGGIEEAEYVMKPALFHTSISQGLVPSLAYHKELGL